LFKQSFRQFGGATVAVGVLAWFVRAWLKQAFQKQLLELQATLRIDESRLSRLHERRATVTEELYVRLIGAVADTEGFLSPADDEANKDAKRKKLGDSLQAFLEFYAKHKIYFSKPTTEKLDALVGAMRRPAIRFSVHLTHSLDGTLGRSKLVDAWIKSSEEFQKLVPPALEAVQEEFRAILGVTAIDAA